MFDPITHEWRYIIPYQSWDDGDVSRPIASVHIQLLANLCEP